MRASKCFFILLAVVAVSAPCRAEKEPTRRKETTEQKIIVEGNNKFAFELYGELRAGKGNLFFSPYSISTALAMTYVGARGQTERQI